MYLGVQDAVKEAYSLGLALCSTLRGIEANTNSMVQFEENPECLS